MFLAKGQKRTIGIEGSGEAAERRKAAAVLEVAAYGRNVDSMMSGPGFHEGPPRHVPHGSCMSLFWEYMGFMKTRGEEPASWSRFYHIFKLVWRDKLRFRKDGGSQHAKCDTCVGLKQDIRNARSLAERHGFLQRYIGHVFEQWRDRMVVWALSTLSVTWTSQAMRLGARLQWICVSSAVLVIVVDGIDPAKFRIPRLSRKGTQETDPD